MKTAAQELPIKPHLLQRKLKILLGKPHWQGAQRRNHSLCTARLKINPANHFTREMVRASGEVILVLGTRKLSAKRAAQKHRR